jgi:hypothetical protein
MRQRRGAYRVMVGKPKEVTTWKTWDKCEDNIQMDLQDTGSGAGKCFTWLQKGSGGRLS